MRRLSFLGTMTMLLLGAAAWFTVVAAERPSSSSSSSSRPHAEQTPGVLEVGHCLVSLDADLQVPALESGPLTSLTVKENEVVESGQVMALVDDRKPQLDRLAAEREREAALARAKDDVETRFSEAAFEVENADLEKALSAKAKLDKSISESEIRRLRLSRKKAELQIEKSLLDRKIAVIQADVHDTAVQQAEYAVQRRRIVAPINGVVASLLRREGEWVNAGDPVIQLIRMDRLRAEGFVNAADHEVSEIVDRPVEIEVELSAGRRERFAGRLVLVSPMVQAGNKYRVRAEVENRTEKGQWLLRPGMSARLFIALK